MEGILGIYQGSNVDMVEIRRYCGIENNRHAWSFEGYDFVFKNKDSVTSILSDTKKEYQYLERISDEESSDYGKYDHRNIKEGEIRIFSVAKEMNPIPPLMLITRNYLKNFIDSNSDYYFPNYQKGKVKKMNMKK